MTSQKKETEQTQEEKIKISEGHFHAPGWNRLLDLFKSPRTIEDMIEGRNIKIGGDEGIYFALLDKDAEIHHENQSTKDGILNSCIYAGRIYVLYTENKIDYSRFSN